MSSALAGFQDAFARALFAPNVPAGAGLAELVSQPGFAVYRNTVMKGCIDALQANYPAVARLVGEEWFRAAAAEFVRGHPAQHPSLLRYGDGFAEFLRGFPPAAELPYLADVARLDRYWTEAHAAQDAEPLQPETLAGLSPELLAETVLVPHPTARWAWFESQPIYTIWGRNRVQAVGDGELGWHGEGALLTRETGVVRWRALDSAGCAFLDACACGEPLGKAAAAALAVKGNADLARLMASLLEAGALVNKGAGTGSPRAQLESTR